MQSSSAHPVAVQLCSTVSALALLACGSSPPVADQPAPSGGQPTSVSSRHEVTPAVPVPSNPAPTTSAASAPTPAPSPFHEYARFGKDVTLYPVGDFALLGGPAVYGFALVLLSATGELDTSDEINRGVPRVLSELHHVVGTWPNATFASYVAANGRVAQSQAMQHGKGGWRDRGVNPARWIDVGLSTWDRGRTLSLSLDSWGFDRQPPKFRVLDGAPRQPVPALARSAQPLPSDGSPGCTSRITPSGFIATRTGHVFVVGTDCDDAGNGAKLEWFAPGKTQGTLIDSPFGGESEAISAAVVSDTEIYLAYGGKLVLFDGQQFTPQGIAFRPRKLSMSKQGTLWATAGSSVWNKTKGGEWQQLSMPPGVEAMDLFVPSDTQVFVGTGAALYSLTAPTEVKQLELEWAQTATRSIKVPKAARDDCKQPYALMYAFTKVTPDDYDFPLTRKAVKGQTWLEGTRFVITEDNGKKYFGAFPTDYATGKKLVALIKKKVKGAIPALLCADPKVVRELPIDLKTGEVQR